MSEESKGSKGSKESVMHITELGRMGMGTTKQLIPLGNRVLLRKIEADQRGGLRMPDSPDINEHTQEFEVVALPPWGASTEPVPLEVDIWTKAEELKIPNMGKPPVWAHTIPQRIMAEQMLGLREAPRKLTTNLASHKPLMSIRFNVGDHIYLARHKGYKLETSSGEELYVAEVEDVLALEAVVPGAVVGGPVVDKKETS